MQNGAMTSAPDSQEVGQQSGLSLTASEYRLLADLVLDQIGADPVRNDGLNYLAQRLFVLAVQAEQNLPQA